MCNIYPLGERHQAGKRKREVGPRGVTTEALDEEGTCICRFFVAQVKRIEKEQFFCPTFFCVMGQFGALTLLGVRVRWGWFNGSMV